MERRRNAFTLIELLVVIAIIGLLISILLPSLALARKSGRAVVCTSNQRQFGLGYSTYAVDFKDRIATFSWKSGNNESQWSALHVPQIFGPANATSDNFAAIDQAVDIARRLSGRSDLLPPANWSPFFYYSHLVMNGYLAQRLPEPMVVCPEDQARLARQRASVSPSTWIPGSNPDWHLAYASSYALVSCAYSADESSGLGQTMGPGPMQDVNTLGQLPLGRRSLADVMYPGQKVCMMDEYSRHKGRFSYYAYDDVVQPVLFFDWSVRYAKTAQSNPGADPNSPSDASPLWINYTPDPTAGDPPTRSGQASELVRAHYQWTRSGLKGVDVGGTEVTR